MTIRVPFGERGQPPSASPFIVVADALAQPVWVASADGSVTHANRSWTLYTGLESRGCCADGWLGGVCEGDRGFVRGAWECALRDGRAGVAEGRLCGTSRCHWFRFRFLPLTGDDGAISHWLCLCEDIHAHKKGVEAADFLARVSATLASSLDYETTLALIARLAVPQVADCCLIDLVDGQGGVKQVAAAHVDPIQEARIVELRRDRPCDPGCPCGIGKVLASGRPEIADRGAGWPAAVACDPADRAVLRDLGASSYMIVPLVARERRLGTITLVTTQSGRHYAAEDLLLAQELAHRAALAIDHALMYEAAQAEIARRAQTEQALRQSQELFSKAFAASPDTISISRVSDGRFVDVNDSFLRLSGFSREEVIGATSLGLGIWADVAERGRMIEVLHSQGSVREYEAAFRTKTGRTITTLLSAQIIDLHGEPHILAVSRDITERKRMEEAQRHSAARFQAQYKALPVPAYIWHRVGDDFVLEDFNDAAMKLSRGHVAGVVGKRAQVVYAQEPAVVADMERCFRDRTLIRREGLFRQLGTGETRCFQATFVFVPPDLVIVYTEDVTDREEAAARLQATLKELADAQFAIDQSAIVSSSDPAGRITYVNDKFCQASGYSRAELIGRDHRVVNSGYHPRVFFEEMWRTIQAGKVWRGEVCNRAKDGTRFWAGTTIVPLLDDKGRPAQYTAIRYDITARKLAEEHVQFQAHMLQLIGEAVIATDLGGQVLYWNRFAEKLFGWPAEEARGRNVVELTARSADLSHARETLRYAAAGEYWVGEQTLQRRDGSTFLASLNVTPLYDGSGHITGTIGVINDITERKRLEEDLTKIQKLESIGVLAGGIAHDFNNILTAIAGNVALAKMYLSRSDKSYDVLTEAEHAFSRARDLTQQLLTFAKGGAPVRKTGSLIPLLDETPRFALTGSNVRCECLVPDDLWPVSFDAGQISQTLNNLLINAKQAMPAGGLITVRAQNLRLRKDEVASLAQGYYVCVSVEDRGVGIPAEHLQKIFDPYFTTKQQGSGLGLATTYSIVRKHDGQITVESRIGDGSRFCIYLPALPGASLQEPADLAQPVVGEGRVLLMDDEAAIRRVAGRLLEGLGYSVDFAADGAETLELYQAALQAGDPYRAVILDLTVPAGMGGEDCIQRLRAIDPRVRAVVSSGYSNDPVMAQYEKFGFVGVVAKPYQLTELSQVLKAAIADKPPT